MDNVSPVGAKQRGGASPVAARPHPPSRHPRPVFRAPAGRRVLVVDDNPTTRAFVRETLTLDGYEVAEADGGDAAIHACAEQPPDLILIDLCLRDMRGTDVIRWLRTDPSTADVPAIVFTGAPEEVEVFDPEARFSDLLTKPVDPEALVAAVHHQLAGDEPRHPGTEFRPRILLVDGDHARSMRVRLHLRGLGFDVLTATTASQALRSARAFRPELVVADLVLPDTTALDLTRSLRSDPTLGRVPVILTSAAPWSEVQARLAERVGATAYVTLTSDLAGLRATVLTAIDQPATPVPVEADSEHDETLLRELHDQYRRHVGSNRTRERGGAELAVLQGLAQALSDTAGLDDVLSGALSRCLHAIGASRGAVYIEELDGGFSRRAHLGDPRRLPGAHLPAAEDLLRRVTVTNETIVVNAHWGEVGPELTGGAGPATILAPLAAGDECFGVLVVEVPGQEDLPYWVHFLKLVGLALGYAVAKARHASAPSPEPGVRSADGRDPLTGLADRSRLEAELAHHLEDPEARGCVLVIDLDRFRHVNDALGHHTGDELIRGVARSLEVVAGPGSTLARVHSDTFALVAPNRDGARIARQVMALLESPVRSNGYTLYTTASIGIACFPEHARRAGMLLQHATTALDLAKERGGNTFEMYTQHRGESLWQRLTVDQGLRAALEREQFLLHYQPIVDLVSGKVAAAEALLRWDRPLHGLTSAADFIEVAEDIGLIVPIGTWVMRTVAQQARDWADTGVGLDHIAVNVGAREFHDGELYDTIVQAQELTGVDPRRLCIEITERIALADVDHAIGTLRRLQALGVRVALDDFGTGYSSLRYLQELPIDTLKIDRSFVAKASVDPRGEPILASIVELAHGLNLTVVAEGIEDARGLELVTSLGCDMAQGYHLGRPAPAPQFLTANPAL